MAAITPGTQVKNASPSRVTTRSVRSCGKQNRISTSFRENIFVCESRASTSSPMAPLLKSPRRLVRKFVNSGSTRGHGRRSEFRFAVSISPRATPSYPKRNTLRWGSVSFRAAQRRIRRSGESWHSRPVQRPRRLCRFLPAGRRPTFLLRCFAGHLRADLFEEFYPGEPNRVLDRGLAVFFQLR